MRDAVTTHEIASVCRALVAVMAAAPLRTDCAAWTPAEQRQAICRLIEALEWQGEEEAAAGAREEASAYGVECWG